MKSSAQSSKLDAILLIMKVYRQGLLMILFLFVGVLLPYCICKRASVVRARGLVLVH